MAGAKFKGFKGVAGNQVLVNLNAIFGVEPDGSKKDTHTFVYSDRDTCLYLNEPVANVVQALAEAGMMAGSENDEG
jgi:hypothetical protein